MTIVLTLVVIALLGVANGYRLERLTAIELPGFSTGDWYLVRNGIDPVYGYKFYVQDDYGQHKILSPWHFGYNFQ